MVIITKKIMISIILCGLFFGFILSIMATNTVYAISINDKPICYVNTMEEGKKVLNSYLTEEKEKYGESVDICENVAFIQGKKDDTVNLVDMDMAKDLLKENLTLAVEYKETVEIPAATDVIPNEDMLVGTQEVVAEGKTGEQQNTVLATVSNDNIKEKKILASEVIVAAENNIVAEGTKPIFHVISNDGGFGVSSIPMAGVISATFGSEGQHWEKTHTGLDIAAPEGVEIKSVGYGKVTFAGERGCYGNFVVVNHGNGVETRYAHMSRIHVQTGDVVNIGDVLGLCGSTGNVTGSHLHFEVKVNGECVNPQGFGY